MPTLFVDFECFMSPAVTLRKMTLRQYLAATKVLGMAYAVDSGPASYYSAEQIPAQRDFLVSVANDPQWVVVAHNAAFDLRVWRDLCDLPWPQTAYCTLELACAAFPCQMGGYGLKNLARTMSLGGEKLDIDLTKASKGGMDDKLAIYCCRDTDLCRAVYNLCVPRLHPKELMVARMCMDVRELHFEIKPDAVQIAFDDFTRIANGAAKEAIEVLGDDGQDAFGQDGDDVRSVKPQTFKALLRDNLGFDTQSISFKKINPEKLRAHSDATKALKAAEMANKALSHKRRVKVFAQVARVDMELGYYRAHTGRFSSPQPGCKGINLHNLAKRNKVVAKAIRSIFRFPEGLCAVRADLANVEYRCLLGGTPILTDSGWKPIDQVLDVDRVWDGIEFVNHGGIVCKGSRAVIDVHGVWMTPDHPVLTDRGWVPAAQAAILPFHHVLAGTVGGLVPAEPSWTRTAGIAVKFAVNADLSRWFPTPTSSAGSAENADLAQQPADGERPESSLIDAFGRSGSNATSESSRRASTHETPTGPTTAGGASDSIQLCGIAKPSCGMFSPYPDGTTLLSRLTAATTTATMPLETFAALPEQSRRLIGVVYDIRDAGPRRRFQAGSLIVHNCEGYLTRCEHTHNLFGRDLMADPYLGFGNLATGRVWTKADPIRQVFKAAVLGLGYLMSFPRFIEELLKSLADPTFGVTVADLEKVVVAQGWSAPNTGYFKGAVTKTRAPLAVAIVAHHMRELFLKMHPEFERLARWLESTVARCYSALDPVDAIERAYHQPQAPDRSLIDLQWAGGLYGPGTKNIRVQCGHWVQPTVTWRDMQMRETEYGVQLCALHQNKGYRPITKNVLIENIVQSAARNALCEAQIKLRGMGYPYQLSVHDELMLIGPRDPGWVLGAREALLKVLGPGNDLGWGWSILINPDEINCSQTLYETNQSLDWWNRLRTGDATPLLEIP